MTLFREEARSAVAGFHAGPLSWSNWNLEMLVFVEGGKETLGARREPTTNSTHLLHRTGIEPRPHWWEASALTTVPRRFSPLLTAPHYVLTLP